MQAKDISARGYRISVQDQGQNLRQVTVQKGGTRKVFQLFTDQFDSAEEREAFQDPIVVFAKTIQIGGEKVALPPLSGTAQEQAQLRGLSGVLDKAASEAPKAVQEVQRQAPIQTHIRWMIRRDMPEVLGIESASFGEPWGEEDFLSTLRQRNCIGMVAEHDDQVVGFMIYELHKNRLELVNLAVDPKVRGSTIGEQMIGKLKGKLSPEGRSAIGLHLAESNTEAQLFFKSMGFEARSVIPEHFESSDGSRETAYRMIHLYDPQGD